ncbi:MULTISPECIES: TetR/AcrR family transcriptional regulator [Lysinibacillus]|uniref:TetR/AcrR family transcriptional regulator n=1 Tax=Lysinibacillus TaxID=400634 RepID=UPI001FCBBB99|nr:MULTISPECIES: TetR/AcrR family transcriptional regulator [Lysinibacillus]MDC6269907.1 TetR/AcrR family transcriptional regulator [Lysinibacillus sphaericus]MDN4971146.1 TetR/AcrR family transcriptional regulator [Lysinibacillus fusiformis]WEA39617.1 TetR/AcrR family transcriptional regulator [Lysinibacillus fusiformis]
MNLLKQSPRVLGRPRHDENAKPTKDLVLDTATKLFIKEGYKNISMDDVAKACNITKATIYYYYPTKGELYTSALIAMMDRIRLSILQILEQQKPFKERLEQLVEVHLSATIDIDMNNFMREASINLSESQLRQVQASENEMYQTIERAMQKEMEKGTIRKGNAKFFAHSFMALMTVGYFKDGDGKTLLGSVDVTAKEVTNFFWLSVQNK